MHALWGGVLAFALLFLYETNNAGAKLSWIRPSFLLGCVLLACSTASLQLTYGSRAPFSPLRLLAAAFCLLFFSLLIHSLFFALPFTDTYCGSPTQLCSTGVYALCRHPGVLWFDGLYLSLLLLSGSTSLALPYGVFCLLNTGYALWQDLTLFPRQFDGYDTYRQQTPFLIPNKSSVARFLSTLPTQEQEDATR